MARHIWRRVSSGNVNPEDGNDTSGYTTIEVGTPPALPVTGESRSSQWSSGGIPGFAIVGGYLVLLWTVEYQFSRSEGHLAYHSTNYGFGSGNTNWPMLLTPPDEAFDYQFTSGPHSVAVHYRNQSVETRVESFDLGSDSLHTIPYRDSPEIPPSGGYLNTDWAESYYEQVIEWRDTALQLGPMDSLAEIPYLIELFTSNADTGDSFKYTALRKSSSYPWPATPVDPDPPSLLAPPVSIYVARQARMYFAGGNPGVS